MRSYGRLRTGADEILAVQAISGDAFDATTILIDETIKCIKTDIRHENAIRREHRQELLPEPWCLWGVTPFKADSRMSQSLTRRSFVFLEVSLALHFNGERADAANFAGVLEGAS